MAYDAGTHQALLFGADNGNATWSWSGTAWTQLDDTSDPGCTDACVASPPGRSTTGMTYDAASRAVVIFGGLGSNDTWAWDGTSWTQVADAGDAGCTAACTSSPPATAGAQMAYDTTTRDVVLFGGSNFADNFNDTWVLTFHAGSYTWSQVDDSGDPGCTDACTSSPPTRNVAALTWDPSTSQLVLFGGEWTSGQANGLSDTWLWNGTSWTQVDDHDGALAGCGESLPTADTCPSSPDGRVGSAVAYDPSIGRLVLFGGMNDYGNPEYDDTWVWNGRAWLQIDDGTDPACTTTCTGAPQARDAFGLIDDAAARQLVMFGGNDLNNTWIAPAIPMVPPAPVHLRAITRGSKMQVLWSMPLLAGPTILGYRAFAAPGGKNCISTVALHCTIGGLSPTLDYTITVRASNLVGAGPAGTLRHARG